MGRQMSAGTHFSDGHLNSIFFVFAVLIGSDLEAVTEQKTGEILHEKHSRNLHLCRERKKRGASNKNTTFALQDSKTSWFYRFTIFRSSATSPLAILKQV